MKQQPKTLQDIFCERRMKDMRREHFFYRVNQVWTLVKRLALLGAIGYGTHWGYKNSATLKSFLKSHSAPIQEVGHNFKEGVGMIKDAMKDKNSNQTKEFHKAQRKRIQEYREMGIDPVVRYAEPGTKEYREELEYYRKNGVFDRD